MREEVIGSARLILGDCREILPTLTGVGAVVTDPPYPDWLADEYKYIDDGLVALNLFKCRQLVFWSTKVPFPLEFTARHVWDKKTSCGSEYEFVYERNGYKNYKVIRHYLINSTVAARLTGDEWTGHKSQKPLKLMLELLAWFPGKPVTIDPFMGSGTTGVACARLGRPFVGVELDPRHFETACRRISEAQCQSDLFVQRAPEPKTVTVDMFA
jgi:site-specific DNA-methyltransferase (adenine-specific)